MEPKYNKLAEILESEINRVYSPGDRFHSISELMNEYGFSLQTVDRALRILVDKGLLTRVQGKGTFVADTSIENASQVTKSVYVVTEIGEISQRNPYSMAIYEGINEAIRGTQVQIAVGSYQDSFQDVLTPSRYDGVFLLAPDEPQRPYVQQIKDMGLPVVIVGAQINDLDVCVVDSDIVNGVYQAVQYLAQNGHRRIGYLGRPEPSAHDTIRFDAFRSCTSELNMETKQEWVASISHRMTQIEDRNELRRAFAGDDRPTCILVSSYFYITPGLIDELRSIDSDNHEGLSIIGFDDLDWLEYVRPPLACIRQMFVEIGRTAMQRLLSQMNNEPAEKLTELFPVELIRRRSVVPLLASV